MTKERLEPQRFSREELEVACMDAHMSGRVYTQGGEKRLPSDEHTHMLRHAMAAVKRHRTDRRRRIRQGESTR